MRLALCLESSGEAYHSFSNLSRRRAALTGDRRREHGIGRGCGDGLIGWIGGHAQANAA